MQQHDDYTATRLYLDGGAQVRVAEDLDQVVARLADAESIDGWAVFGDPGDERTKVVRAKRVFWFEQEPIRA